MTDPEAALLGAVLTGYPDLGRLQNLFRPEDFAHPTHAALWEDILQIRRTGAPVDPVTVLAHLQHTHGAGAGPGGGRWPTGDGPLWLAGLATVETCPIPAAAPWYAQAVHTAGVSRRLQGAAATITQLTEHGGEPAETIDAARRAWAAAAEDAAQGTGFDMADALAAFADDLDAHHVTGPDTPWPDLNRLLGTLDPGRLYVAGARPGVGKSVLATNMATHAAITKGRRVLLCSLEMSTNEVLARILSAAARVNLSRVMGRTVDDAELARMVAQFDALTDGGRLDIDDGPRQTVSHIQQRAAAHGAELVIVDYLQLVKPNDARLPRHEQVTQITRDLKLAARELGCTVLAAAQVNRAAAARHEGRPTLSDLRESGSIEADADGVLLMADDPDSAEVTVDVAKNRHGPRGEVTLLAQGHYARLVSAQWSPAGQGS